MRRISQSTVRDPKCQGPGWAARWTVGESKSSPARTPHICGAIRGGNRDFVGGALHIRTQYRPPDAHLRRAGPPPSLVTGSSALWCEIGVIDEGWPPESGYFDRMDFLLWILAVVLVVAGVVSIVRSQVLWGVVLIIVGLLVGPGGVSLLT